MSKDNDGVCGHCGHCKHCGHTPEPVKPAAPVFPWINPQPQPWRFDGSWICACGQRVYSHQVHSCPLGIGPTWTSSGSITLSAGNS